MIITLNPGDEYMGFIYCGTNSINVGSRSMRKLRFKCKCNNIKDIYIGSVTKNQKTCGDCDKIWLNHGDKYHKFTYVGDSKLLSSLSSKELPFKCMCGKTKLIRIYSVTTESTISCNECNNITLNSGDVFHGFSYVGDRISVGPNSTRKLSFKCSCGKVKPIKISNISSGHSKTCGECNEFELNPGDKYLSFIYVGDKVTTSDGSHQELLFQCACGKRKSLKPCYISNSAIKSCGKCNHIALSDGVKHGNFTYVGLDIELSKWNRVKLSFTCQCGNVKNISVKNITCGKSRTCGECRNNVFDWYQRNTDILMSMKSPITPEMIPTGGVMILDEITNTGKPVNAVCPACSSVYRPRFSDIKRGLSLTCGCVSNRISDPCRKIASYISSLGYDTKFEFKLGGKWYDICVLDKKLLIEYNGFIWHSSDVSIKNDKEKQAMADKFGFDLLTIQEKEWKNNQKLVLDVVYKKLTSR